MTWFSQWKSDRSLLRLAKNGDAQAVEALMNLLLKPAHSLAWQILRNQADAEDVVQEAFLLLWRSSENFAGTSSLKTYFTKIVMNEC